MKRTLYFLNLASAALPQNEALMFFIWIGVWSNVFVCLCSVKFSDGTCTFCCSEKLSKEWRLMELSSFLYFPAIFLLPSLLPPIFFFFSPPFTCLFFPSLFSSFIPSLCPSIRSKLQKKTSSFSLLSWQLVPQRGESKSSSYNSAISDFQMYVISFIDIYLSFTNEGYLIL